MSQKNKYSAKAERLREKGCELLKNGQYYNSLVRFNESLCHAVPGSASMALAYANRSAVYIEVNQYEKCLESIAAALNCDFPEDKKPKLIERKKLCEQKMEEGNQEEAVPFEYEFKLTYPANPKLPCLADCLELRNNAKYGNHIITTQTLYPGDIVAVEDFFYFSVTKHSQADLAYRSIVSEPCEHVFYQLCAFCLRPNLLSLYPCDTCIATMYCSEECRAKAKDCHDFECEILDEIMDINLTLSVRTFFQALAICNNDIDELQKLITNHIANGSPSLTAFNLDYTTMSQDEIRKLSILVAYSGQLFENINTFELGFIEYLLFVNPKMSNMMMTHGDFIMAFITHMDQVQSKNAFCFSSAIPKKDATLIFAGEVQQLALSLFNHSCAPNVFRVQNQKSYALVVSQEIEAGEQIFDCYTGDYLFVEKASRQYFLSHYDFQCDCVACRFEYPLHQDIVTTGSEMEQTAAAQMDLIIRLEKSGRLLVEFAIRLMQKCIQQLRDIYAKDKEAMNLDLREDVILLRLSFLRLMSFCAYQVRIKFA